MNSTAKETILTFKKDRLIFVLFLIVFIKGIVLIFFIPPFQTPDEDNHYDYAIYLSKINIFKFVTGKYNLSNIYAENTVTHEVSFLQSITNFHNITFNYNEKVKISFWESIKKAKEYKDLDTAESLSQNRLISGQFNYPPFYYLFVSIPLRIIDLLEINIVIKYLIARFISFCLFMASLVYAFKCLKIINFNKYVNVIILTIIALQPELSMLSISIQSDIMVLLLINVCLYSALRFMNFFRIKDLYYLNIFSGLLLLTKIHFFISLYLPLICLTSIILFFKKQINKRIIGHFIIGFLIMLFIGGWWYLRSYLLFDNFAGFISIQSTGGSFLHNIQFWFFHRGPRIFISFWGVWGHFDYLYPLFVFYFLLIFSFIPIPFWLFHLFILVRKFKNKLFKEILNNKQAINILFCTAPLFLYFFVMIYIAGKMGPYTNDQGRNWLPFILPFAIYLGGFYQRLNPKSFLKGFFVDRIKQLQVIMYGHIVLFGILNIYMIFLTYQRYYLVT